MSREASTSDRTEQIKNKLQSDNCKAEMKLEYWYNNDWNLLLDLDVDTGIDINKSAKNYKYANFALTPLASGISFKVINKNGEYSDGSGTSKEGVLNLNTKIRVQGGYLLDYLSSNQTQALTLNDDDAFYYYTQDDSGNVILDSANSGGETDTYFTDLFDELYDSGEKYDSITHTPAGYYLTTYDFADQRYEKVINIIVNTNTTNGIIYYRLFNDLDYVNLYENDSTSWTNGGAIINGDQTVTINQEGYRYIQIAVIFDSVPWSGVQINSITITYQSYVEWIYTDIFYLDTPSFSENSDPDFATIDCSGRNIWKKAIEDSINLQDLSGGGGTALDDLIKDICDIEGIAYSASSIADLSGFTNRTLATGYGDQEKIITIFENIMQIINQEGSTYQMYVEYDSTEEDTILFVQPVPALYEADFVFNYKNYLGIESQRKNYDKLLKRITVLSDQQVANAETQLDTANYTTAGQKTLSWVNTAEYKRYIVTLNSGTLPTITLDEVNPTSIIFTLGSGTFDLDITVYGNDWNSDPDFEGEGINHTNMINNQGNTSVIINPLVISDNECRDIAKGFIDKFGIPVDETFGLSYPYLNFLLEINDMTLLWSRYIFRDDLRYITGMTYHWDFGENPSDSCTFDLSDSGLNFTDEGDFIYDRDMYNSSINPMKHDYGFIYDMSYGVQGTEDDVDTSIYKQNVDFV